MFKKTVLVSALCLMAATPAISDTFTTNSEALFDKVQTKFPEFFPTPVATQQLSDKDTYPILFRAYPNGWITATYWWGWGVQRIYYSPDGGMNWVYSGTLEDGNYYLCGNTCWTPNTEDEVKSVVMATLSLTGSATDGGITQQLNTILSSILTSNSGTCPAVVSNPSTINLSAPPSLWQINISYGGGCTATDGSLMKGSAAIKLANISLGSTGIRADIDATFNNITKNGKLFASGNVTGNVNLSISGSSLGGNVALHLSNYIMPTGEGVNGDISIQPSGVLGDFNASVNTSTLLYPATGISVPGGDQNINLAVKKQADKSELINGTGAAYGFSLQFVNLVYNTQLCQSYPVAGSIKFTKNNTTSTVTFNSNCNGSYIYN